MRLPFHLMRMHCDTRSGVSRPDRQIVDKETICGRVPPERLTGNGMETNAWIL